MQINIPEHAENWLRQRAEQSGYGTVEDYVLAIVLPLQSPEGQSNGQSFFDAASAIGLIGGGSDYAPDLSTNPKHMKGFGR
jgi:hypothetical protein